MQEFLLFAAVGFLAQAVDGALGMAYGVISSTTLLAFGVSPAHASAAVHAAELFTTAASGTSHLYHRNIDWRLFWRLMPFGVLGGILGAFVLTSFAGSVMKPYVTAYLALVGAYLLIRLPQGSVKPDAGRGRGAARPRRRFPGRSRRRRLGAGGDHGPARIWRHSALCDRHRKCQRVPDHAVGLADFPVRNSDRPLGGSGRNHARISLPWAVSCLVACLLLRWRA